MTVQQIEVQLPASWQCVTPGCGRARYEGEWCDACARKAAKATVLAKPAVVVTPKTWETGERRRLDGRNERQMTDGVMRWWVSA